MIGPLVKFVRASNSFKIVLKYFGKVWRKSNVFNTILLVTRSLSFYLITSQREFSNRKKSCVKEELSDVNKSLCKNIFLVSTHLCTSPLVRAPIQLKISISPTTPSTPWHVRSRLLPYLKRWKLSTAHMPGRWRGGRWNGKCQLDRCTNQRWGAQVRTHQKDVLAQWFVDITEFFFETTFFYD